LIAPIQADGATAWIEEHSALTLPRMCIVAESGPPLTDAAIDSFLAFLDNALALERPFTIFWDVGKPDSSFPSMKQFMKVIRWMEIDTRGEAWDNFVQGHAILVNKPLLRNTIRLMVSIAKPPQPVRVVNSRSSAYAFARNAAERSRRASG